MLSSLKIKLTSLIGTDNQRSRTAIRNILLSFGVKGGGILVSLVLVPMTIDYVNPVQYGLWLTISSMLGWMNFFDIGFGNGLRNNLASSIADNNMDDARRYVSTTYAALAVISAVLFVLFWLINPSLNWNEWLNTPAELSGNIHSIMLIVLSSFCFLFIAQLINTVLTAIHKPAVASLLTFLGQLVALFLIFIFKKITPGTLTTLIWILTSTPICVFILASIFLYHSKLAYLAPTYKSIDWRHAKKLMGTGGVFFLIQIGTMLLFQTNNIIITNIMGPQSVTDFNVSYKLFSVIILTFTIIITPYWSAFTDAYVKRDFTWMKATIRNIRFIWLALSFLSIITLVFSKNIQHTWVGSKILFRWDLSIAMTIYVIVYMWQTLHVYFLNGIGKVKLQLILFIVGATVNIPLAIYMGKSWGLAGVISANSIVFLIMGIIFSFQVKYILSNEAKGIWSS